MTDHLLALTDAGGTVPPSWASPVGCAPAGTG